MNPLEIFIIVMIVISIFPVSLLLNAITTAISTKRIKNNAFLLREILFFEKNVRDINLTKIEKKLKKFNRSENIEINLKNFSFVFCNYLHQSQRLFGRLFLQFCYYFRTTQVRLNLLSMLNLIDINEDAKSFHDFITVKIEGARYIEEKESSSKFAMFSRVSSTIIAVVGGVVAIVIAAIS
ncbi:MAG: hypothetical protein FWE22_01155 [Firmicutes bacterium]|nr:hypothetical protein [Bacillota bacterium]